MTNDLIARLRALSQHEHSDYSIGDEAADALEAAQKDKSLLDWFDNNAFTAYRAIDPIDGLAKHCVVVDDSKKPRRGNTGTIREAIDSARETRNG